MCNIALFLLLYWVHLSLVHVQVAVGFSHMVAVTYEHMVFSWGVGSRGQLGHEDVSHRSSPEVVEALKGRTIIR